MASNLIDIVKSKDDAKLSAAIKNSTDQDAAKALNAAIKEGYSNGVEIILKSKPELAKSESPELPILTAAKSGASEKIVNSLISNGADVNARDKKDRNKTALILAACGCFSDTAEALLKHQECDRNAICDPPAKVTRLDHINTGITALIAAILQGKKGAPVVEALTRNGADVNITGETQMDGKVTPLMLAAELGLTNVVEMLLKAGAPVDQKDGCNMTALHWAVKGAQLDKHHEADVVKPLINAGADLEAISNCGGDKITPVLRAANIGTYLAPIGHDLLKLLIEAGSKINNKDMYGKTILHRALECNWGDIVDMLFERGVDVTLCDYSGHSVMYDIAYAYESNPELLLKLLDWNCDVRGTYTLTEQCNIRIPNLNLMDVAFHSGNLKLVPYLIAAGCSFPKKMEESRGRVVMEDDFLDWTIQYSLQVPSLKNKCRVALRRAVPTGCHLESVFKKLSIPNNLIQFLLLRTGVDCP